MKRVQVDIGVHTADAEDVAVQLHGDRLLLTYVDWRERPQRKMFVDVLAFRWQEPELDELRDDVVYEVVGSPWLERQCELQAVSIEERAHYELRFNACGVLDVVCRRDRGAE